MKKRSKQRKKIRHQRPRRKSTKFARPKTLEAFFAMPTHIQQLYASVTQAISRMRSDRVSLLRAAQEFGIRPREIQKVGRSAIRKATNGRYVVTKRDSLLRVLLIPTDQGLAEIGVSDSRQASVLGEYWNTVQRYLSTGDASLLREFRAKHITDSEGRQFPLLTDEKELDRLGSAGVLSFESLYARAA